MVEKPSTVDEAITYVWDVPNTVIGPADKQSLAAALAEKTDAVTKRYFSAPNPELWVGTLRELLKPTGTAAGQSAFFIHVASPDEDIDAVDAETDETPVRSFKVSRNHQGKLFLEGIEKALANRGLGLRGIGEDGFPAHKDGWTIIS